jgi:hypothetical protein
MLAWIALFAMLFGRKIAMDDDGADDSCIVQQGSDTGG